MASQTLKRLPHRTRLSVRRATLNLLSGRAVTVAGSLVPKAPRERVGLQVLGRHGWRIVAHALTGARGRFTLHYLPGSTGSVQLRVHFSGDGSALPSTRRLGRLTVYRLATASWYGGGGGLACGGQLTSSTLGVANKTLPCGTIVTLRDNGHTLRVPVVDRGPFVAGREFDLTEATKDALGFEGVGDVWVTP
ncbi:MAG TPA: septal ring lytic transglycosylase RlpA family protein [Solirubrobacteraceae bacterium]|jgi:hypothetical protein|nr:septal ring lytic transglycosylase RlpA family protein [Solirubrobacteraceae bacterium]